MQLFANNAYGALASGVSDADTSLVLATGQGARFPTPTNGEYFLATLIAIDGGGAESAWEIVQVTARSTDTLTVVRAQEGTSATAWPAGTRIELRLTSGTMTRIASRAVDGGFAAASYGTIQEINGGSANG